MHKRFE